jgi:DNA-binding NarL/FixJ family response regulator
MSEIKVLIADDHYIVRLGLKVLINSFEGFEVTSDVENGQEALENIELAEFLILDLEMPIIDGVSALKIIKKNYPDKKVILLTNCMDIPTLVEARNLKPQGFLFKDGMLDELKVCLDEIKKGHIFRGRNCTTFFEQHKEEFDDVERLVDNLNILTKTEIKVLQKVSENFSTSEIAEALFNSPKTIDNHRTNIAKKLDISGYNNLQAFAIKYKLLVDSFFNSNQ